MGWRTVFLIIAIIVGLIGIWNLARQRNVFLSLTGIFWFLIVLFAQYIPKAYDHRLASGLPKLGTLFLYVIVPVFVILAFFTTDNRR